MSRLAVVMGTRPEVIKLAPVVAAARARGSDVTVIATGQHAEMLDQMLRDFELEPDHSLAVMRHGQSLSSLTARLVEGLGVLFETTRPEFVAVQGDTTSALCGALAAFYSGIDVAHVEAGLRSSDLCSPFPEEANRRLIAPLADYHFCPTRRAAMNLASENVASERIHVVGNTVIDALGWACERLAGRASLDLPSAPKRILVTLHRRESHGRRLTGIALALRRIASRGDAAILFPLHRSQAVRNQVLPVLVNVPGVKLCEPLGYFDLVQALLWCDLVLTDSGGLQEEAPSLGKPVLVAREKTERPEAIEAGVARLVGTKPARLIAETERLLDDTQAYAAMARVANPFGDGRASERIVEVLGLGDDLADAA